MQLSDFDASSNLVALFLSRADELGDKPMLWARRDGAWQSLSWTEAARRVCLIAQSLRALGLGDGERVLLVSENRPEWCLADLAIMAAGCVTVPAYTTNTERDHLHVLENSGARAVTCAWPSAFNAGIIASSADPCSTLITSPGANSTGRASA